MTPQELQYVQVKIGNSFLRSFYPADYRVMQQSSGELVKLEVEEYRKLKTTASLTSKLNVKLARTVGLLQKEIVDLLNALDSTQNAVYTIGDEMVDAEALDEAMQRTTGGFDLFNTWRQIARARRILRSRERKIERQRAKAKKQADAKAASEKAAADAEKARVAAEENLNRAKQAEVKPKTAAEAPKVGPEPLPANKSLVTVADDFAKAPSAATESAFKAALKRSTDPKSVMAALKSAKNAYVAFDSAATKVLSKILGSKLVRWGGLALIVAIETWSGWEEYVLVMEAYEKGYISMAMKNTLVRNIIAVHGVTLVAAYVFGELGAIIGAAVGAPALGIGAIVGGILGAILLGSAGAMAATYFVEILLENKTFSDYFGDVLEAFGAGEYDEEPASSITVTQPQAQVSPATSITPSAAFAAEPAAQPTQVPQTVAEPVEPPPGVEAPARQVLAGIVPAPINIETPGLEPPVSDAPADISPNEVRDRIANQLGSSQPQAMPSADTDATVTDNNNNFQQTSFSPEVQMEGGVEGAEIPSESTGNVKVVEAYGPNRPGRPIAKIRNIAVRAAEKVGMSQINFTSGVGNWISPKRRAAGQKSTRHAHGDALDVTGFTSERQAVAFMQTARQLGAGGVGWYNDGSVHIDLGTPREWDRAKGIPGLAEGGKIHPKEGGTLALVAEAGEPEYIVPQSKVENFAHEMLAARPSSRNKMKKHTHLMIVPIYT